MNASGIRTRNNILDTAIRLFMEKGYSNVTMSDFCQECRLSRGGLYGHFHSTAEIFEAMLVRDKEDVSAVLEKEIHAGKSASQMLKSYLDQTYADIQCGSGRLSLAAYEYVRSGEAKPGFAEERYEAALFITKNLLRYGMDRKEFSVSNLQKTAEHFVIFIDGLRLASAFSVDKETVKRQLDELYHSVLA